MKPFAIFLLSLLCVHSDAYGIVVVYTAATPSTLPESLKETILIDQSLSGSGVEIANITEFRKSITEKSGERVVIDACFSAAVSKELSQLCVEAEIVHFALMPVEDESAVGRWTYAVGGSFRGYVEAIKAVKAFFKFKTVNVLSDVSDLSLFFANALSSEEKLDYDTVYFPADSDETKIIGKIVRPKGNRVSIITTDPKVTMSILKAQQSMHIGGIGFGNILPLVSSLSDGNTEHEEYDIHNGNLIVADERFAAVNSVTQYFNVGMANIARYLATYRSIETLVSQLTFDFVQADYVLLNQQSGRLVHVGDIANGTYIPLAEVVFLGNTTVIPRNSTSPINISGNFGNTDPVGFFTYLTPMYAGSLLAISDVNKRSDILPNFNIELWNFTGGYSLFNATYLKTEIMPQRNKFGAAIIGSIASSFNIPFLWLLDKYNDSTPVIGSATTFPPLSSKEMFPNFIRTAISDQFMNIVIVQIFKRFGWTKCGFIAEDLDPIGYEAQAQFHALMNQSGITIVNDPKYQLLATNVTSVPEAIAKYSESLQHFIDTQVRVLLIVAVYIPQYIPVVLYELGLRRGDVIIIGREWIANYAFDSLSDEERLKAAEVMAGALQFSPDRFVGTVGQKVLRNFKEVYGVEPSTYSCFFYDSAFTIAVALDWLVNSGFDYMNHTVMMTALRQSRFEGCTGIVSFETNSNDRNEVRFVLETIVFNETTPSMQRAGLYDPHGMVLLSIIPNYTWPDSTINVPKDTRNSTIDCPFEDRLNTYFPQGEYLLIGLSAGISLYSATVSFTLWRLMRTRSLEYLRDPKEIEIEDFVVLLSVFTEFLQLVSLSPSLAFIHDTLGLVLDAAIWNGEQVLPLHNGGFEKVWVFAQSWVVFWLFVSLYTYIRKGLQKDYSFRYLELLCYLIETMLFIPIFSTLMDTFICRSGVSPPFSPVSFPESYLESDCYVSCWHWKHSLYVGISLLFLLVFIPCATMLGVIWQDRKESLHVKWSPGLVTFRNFVHILLVSVTKITKRWYSWLHGVVFISILVVYSAFALCHVSYGYARVRFWHILSIFTLIWTAIISTACEIVQNPAKRVTFMSLVLSGWGAAGIFGLLFQALALPAMLFRPKGVNTLYLFKFAFQPATESIVTNLQAEFSRVGSVAKVTRRPNSSMGEESIAELQYTSQPAVMTNGV